jgi:FHA domain-containing protein
VCRSLRPARLFLRWAAAVCMFLVVFAGSLLAWEALRLPPSSAADRLAVALGVAAALSGASGMVFGWWAPREDPPGYRKPVAYLALMDGQPPELFTPLRSGVSVIGRDPDGEVVVPSGLTSIHRLHARISCDDTGCSVQSIRRNETYVGNEAVPASPGSRPLADGDLICLTAPADSKPPPRTYMYIRDPSQIRIPTTDRTSRRKAATVLVLMSGPGRDGALQLDGEVKAIDQAVLAVRGDAIALRLSRATSLPGLAQAVLEHRPLIVHFSGCGSGQDGVSLTAGDPDGGSASPDELDRFFQLRAPWVSCVVLSACYVREQGIAIARHVGYVIGTPASIPPGAAMSFSAAFYQALAAELPVRKAFAHARNAVNRQLWPGERATPVLLTPGDARQQRAASRRRGHASSRKEQHSAAQG